MFSQDHQGILSLGRTNLDDCIHNALSELNIAFFFQAVCQELQQHVSLSRKSVIKECSALDSFDFEVKSQVRQVVTNLFEQFLHTVFIASLQES